MQWLDQQLTLLHPGAGYTLLLVALLTLFLRRYGKSERKSVMGAAVGFLVCLAVLAVAAGMAAAGFAEAAGYVRGIAVFGEGMCLIALAGIAVFRVLLPAARVSTPRILQDIATAGAYLVWAFIWLRANRV